MCRQFSLQFTNNLLLLGVVFFIEGVGVAIVLQSDGDDAVVSE
jgi:hypothetical protein